MLNENIIIYLLFNKEPPQKGRDDLSLHIPTTHGNSPFEADIPPSILSLIFWLYVLEWLISEMCWDWLSTFSSPLVILEDLVALLCFTSLQLIFQTLQMYAALQNFHDFKMQSTAKYERRFVIFTLYLYKSCYTINVPEVLKIETKSYLFNALKLGIRPDWITRRHPLHLFNHLNV